MAKATLLSLAILVGSALSGLAEEIFQTNSSVALYQPQIFNTIDSSLLLRDLPIAAFMDGRVPGSSAMGRMGIAPIVNFPVALVSTVPTRPVHSGQTVETDGKESPADQSLEKAPQIFSSGEIGVFYGRSIGKHGGDDYGSYFESSVGNDKFQINVGGSYQESSGRFQRWGR